MDLGSAAKDVPRAVVCNRKLEEGLVRPVKMYYGPGGMGETDGGLSKMDELDYELWHACAGPLTSLPPVDSLVMYWPQGHIEQVFVCMCACAIEFVHLLCCLRVRPVVRDLCFLIVRSSFVILSIEV